jgi:hypothetical protein
MAKTRSNNYQKWSVRTKANKILTEGLKAGTIDGSMKPKQLWESNAEFGQYSLSLFCLALNRNNKNNAGFIRDEGELNCVLLSPDDLACTTNSAFFSCFSFLLV